MNGVSFIIRICHQAASNHITRQYLTKHKKQITPWELSDDSSQGEAIEFAQFMRGKIYMEFFKSSAVF